MTLSVERQQQMDLSPVEGYTNAYLRYDKYDGSAVVYVEDDRETLGVALAGIWYLGRDGEPVDNYVRGSAEWTREVAVRELVRRECGPTGQGERRP